MRDVIITVKGMGGGINFEMKVIQDALEAAGITVKVENDSADWMGGMTQVWMDKVIAKNKQESPTAVLKANHIPWGG